MEFADSKPTRDQPPAHDEINVSGHDIYLLASDAEPDALADSETVAVDMKRISRGGEANPPRADRRAGHRTTQRPAGT